MGYCDNLIRGCGLHGKRRLLPADGFVAAWVTWAGGGGRKLWKFLLGTYCELASLLCPGDGLSQSAIGHYSWEAVVSPISDMRILKGRFSLLLEVTE